MTGYQLRAWREERGWSQAAAAGSMDVGLRTYIRWEKRGPRKIPKVVELACQALRAAHDSTEER